jgi:hypothetical protein
MLVLLVAATKILAAKAGTSFDQAQLPCRPARLVLCRLLALALADVDYL